MRHVFLLFVCLLGLHACVSEPKQHFIHKNNELIAPGSYGPPYLVRTRIWIEHYRGFSAVSESDAKFILDYASNYFSPIDLHFYVQDIYVLESEHLNTFTYKLAIDNVDLCCNDSLNIIFFLPRDDVKNSGYSSFPWENKHYVAVSSSRPSTLGHELGHFFGLYHTFSNNGDGVSDTYHTDDPAYNNLMNYSEAVIQYLTPGQLNKVQNMLDTYRKDVLIFSESIH